MSSSERAFPSTGEAWYSEGMTLRDYFAAKAMHGAMIGEDYRHCEEASDLAATAYAIADAMLIERNRK